MPDTGRFVVENITSCGQQYTMYSDDTEWTRRVDTQRKALYEWGQVESNPLQVPEPLKLHVIAESQAEDEPKHRSLHALREDANGATRRQVRQVTGDAKLMRFDPAESSNPFNSASFAWHQIVNAHLSDSDLSKVDQMARSESPPRAKNRKEVKEKCQGWTIRLLSRLVS